MDDLPNELVALILKYTTKPHYCPCVCAQVCRKWKEIIGDTIGYPRVIGSLPPNVALTEFPKQFSSVDVIGEIGVNYCVLGNIREEKVPNFQKWNLVKTIRIVGPISLSNFNNLIPPLGNLTTLSLHMSSLNSFSFDKAIMKFPKLKEFTICGDDRLEDFMKSLKLENHNLIASNLLVLLLDMNLPSVKTLFLIGIPLIGTNEGILIKAILHFLGKHAKTVKKFGFLESKLRLTPNITLPVVQLLSPKQVENIKLQTLDAFACAAEHNIWEILDPLIQTQKCLRHYTNTLLVQPIPGDLYQKNSSTLTSIELLVKFAYFLNCETLAACNFLRFLTVIGTRFSNPMIRNTSLLPNSLQSIRFYGVTLISEDANNLMTREWTGLKMLKLSKLRTGYGYGVPLSSLCQALAQKIIQIISISDALDPDSFSPFENMSENSIPPIISKILKEPITLKPCKIKIYLENSEYIHSPGTTPRSLLAITYPTERLMTFRTIQDNMTTGFQMVISFKCSYVLP